MNIYPQLTEIFRDTLDEPDLVLTPELSARNVAEIAQDLSSKQENSTADARR